MGSSSCQREPGGPARRFASLGLAAAPFAMVLFMVALFGCDDGADSTSPTVPAAVPPAPTPEPEPTKDDPAAFTQAFVQRAVDLFDAEGLDATLAAYNDPASVDESWYVFIIDADTLLVIAHATVPENIGDSVLGPLGVDSAGNIFGPALAAATADGSWVDYNYFNPETDDEGIKHTWAVRHEGLLFGSGWYEGAPTDSSIEAQTRGVVRQAVGWVRESGLEAAIDFYNTPASTTGSWYVVFLDDLGIAVSNGANPVLVGKSALGVLGVDVTGKVFGPEFLRLPPEGGWVDYAYLNPATGDQGVKHSWAQLAEGHRIISGWYESGPVEADPAARAVGAVEAAIQFAEAYGEEAAVVFYNTDASYFGSWYVFLIDADGTLVAIAPAPEKLGINAYDPEDGTDITGQFYAELAQATEEGVWVTYWQPNPGAGGEQQLKHTFARRRGNLVFAAGYYEE